MLPPQTKQGRLEDMIGAILGGQQQIVSYAGASQYQDVKGVGTGASSCGLAALNFVRIVFRLYEGLKAPPHSSPVDDARRLLNGVLCRQTVEEIISICSSWPSDNHLEVEELLKIPIFKQNFEKAHVQYALTDQANFFKVLQDMENSKTIPVAAILTRSPEIIACVKIPTDHSGDVFIVFDSHPRQAHPNGAAFIVNTSMESTAAYLDNLLSIDPKILADPTMRWQAQLFGQFSSHIVTPNSSPLTPTGLEDILMESSTTILRLQAELGNAHRRSEELAAEIDRLNSKVAELELTNEEKAVQNQEPVRPVNQCHYANGPPPWQASTSGSSTSGPAASMVHGSQSPNHSDDEAALNPSENLVNQLQMQYQEEDRVLAAERAALSARETATFQCEICFDDMRIDYLAQMDECAHSFCRDCLRAHVTSTISERRYPVLCPVCMADKNASEPTKISETILSTIGLIGDDMDLLRSLQIAPYSIALHCRKCKQTMYVDRKDHQESSIITCPLRGCNYVWCKNCERQIAIGGPQHSCDGSSELQHLMQKRGWKACPGCQTPIQKEDGCNHMTCISPGCNVHFCYVCGDLIIQSVARREIDRATSAHYAKCRLFEYPRRR